MRSGLFCDAVAPVPPTFLAAYLAMSFYLGSSCCHTYCFSCSAAVAACSLDAATVSLAAPVPPPTAPAADVASGSGSLAASAWFCCSCFCCFSYCSMAPVCVTATILPL